MHTDIIQKEGEQNHKIYSLWQGSPLSEYKP